MSNFNTKSSKPKNKAQLEKILEHRRKHNVDEYLTQFFNSFENYIKVGVQSFGDIGWSNAVSLYV